MIDPCGKCAYVMDHAYFYIIVGTGTISLISHGWLVLFLWSPTLKKPISSFSDSV